MLCTILRSTHYDTRASALCTGGTPLPIPDGEPVPNHSPGDSWLTRLGEFDAQLRGRPGTLVGLYMRVEAADYLEGWPEDSNPWCIELLFATVHMADRGRGALACCGQDDPRKEPGARTRAGRLRSRRIVEECAIAYGACAGAFTGFCVDDDVDAAVAEALTQAQLLLMTPGFYLDRQMNAIGDSGWDFIEGNIGASLRPRR